MTLSKAIDSSSETRRAIAELAGSLSYLATTEHHIARTPYHRPLDAARLANLDWSTTLPARGLLSDESLVANRLLVNIYESDALFLPADGLGGREAEFESFYDGRNRWCADVMRADVESYVFGCLEQEIDLTGTWDCDALEAHVTSAIDDAVSADRPVLRAIEESAEPAAGAEIMIVQMALDGLTEATAMSQNLGGAYGPEQSELFKIFIDEFGYGVYNAKHSTLFTELCHSIGMRTDPHCYWFYYLPTWLAGNNYFYRVTRNRSDFFRYIGGMAFLEATFAPSFAAMTKTFRAVYGDRIDTRYCDEHAHIDQHHGRMAVHDLLLPLARKHGDRAIRDLVRGVEEVRLLGRLNDEELIGQITWSPVVQAAPKPSGRTTELTRATPFSTGVAATDTLVSVRTGHVNLHWRPTTGPLRLGPGEAVLVPAGRLYGLRATEAATVDIASDGVA